MTSLILPLHAACVTQTDGASNDATAAPVEDLQCDVVSVGVSELEEGFGSYYDITDDGYSNADEDAEDISVDADGISLGHHSFTREDGDSISFTAATEDAPYRTWTLETSNDETYTIRVFKNELGIINYGDDRMGTLDCRGVLDTEPEVTDVAKMDRCNIVWVNEDINANLWEEGLGSIYDIDDQGYSMADGSSIELFIEPTAGQRSISIGQTSFAESEGDTIEVVDADEYLTYVVRPAEDDDYYSVRIFRAANDAEIPGIGMVLFHDSGAAAGEQLAIIDCRGIDLPEEND